MTTKQVLFPLLGLGMLFSCQEKNEDLEPVTSSIISKAVFSGYAQKGPFVNGSSVAILELDENLDQTGKTYFTTITDNSGSFEKKNMELVSNYASLKADGYYFNEVSGETSTGQITLYALVDVEDVNSANVNVLTHLEYARVEYLVQQKALSFTEAKQQAQKEIMNIFGFSTSETTAFESFNLTDNAFLLAISSILQGSLSTGDMAALMADIITDIRIDGVLDNTTLIAKLINNAETVSSVDVRNNLIAKYAELGVNVNIPDFKSHVQSFINSNVDPTAMITYPETGLYGANILSDAVTTVLTDVEQMYYSLRADVPLGMSLKIIVKDDNRLGSSGSIYIGAADGDGNWHIGLRDLDTYNQEYSMIVSGQPCDIKLGFFAAKRFQEIYRDYITIEYYENGAITPTKTKKLYVKNPEY